MGFNITDFFTGIQFPLEMAFRREKFVEYKIRAAKSPRLLVKSVPDGFQRSAADKLFRDLFSGDFLAVAGRKNLPLNFRERDGIKASRWRRVFGVSGKFLTRPESPLSFRNKSYQRVHQRSEFRDWRWPCQ